MAKAGGGKVNRGYKSQAAADALVRFGPQIAALKAAADDAVSSYQAAASTARTTGAGTQASVDRALPQARTIYADAAAPYAAANQVASQNLAGLGSSPGVDAIKAGLAGEQQVFNQQTAGAQAAVVADLLSRRTRAAEGVQFATGNARDQLATALGKIGQQGQNLGAQSGAFQQSLIDKLRTADQRQSFQAGQNARQRANSRLVAGVDASGQVIPGSKADLAAKARASKAAAKASVRILPGGAKQATTAAHTSFLDGLSKINTVARPAATFAKQGGYDRAYVARLLQTGHKGTDTTPAVPAITDQFKLSVALDLLFDGHVSHGNAVALHRRGLSLKALGLAGPPPKKLVGLVN